MSSGTPASFAVTSTATTTATNVTACPTMGSKNHQPKSVLMPRRHHGCRLPGQMRSTMPNPTLRITNAIASLAIVPTVCLRKRILAQPYVQPVTIRWRRNLVRPASAEVAPGMALPPSGAVARNYRVVGRWRRGVSIGASSRLVDSELPLQLFHGREAARNRSRWPRRHHHEPGQGVLPGRGLHEARPRQLLPGRRRRRPAGRHAPADGAQALRQRRRPGAVLPEARARRSCRPVSRPPTSPSPAAAPPTSPSATTPPTWSGSINLGCLDLNPWPVRANDVDHPDELRVDLDPTPEATFARRQAGRALRQRSAARPRLSRLPEDLRLARHPHQRPHRAEVGLHRRAPLRPRARPRGRAPHPGHRDDEVVEGRAPRRLHRLQPERPRPHRRLRLLRAPDRRMRASPRRSTGTKLPDVELADFTIETVPGATPRIGDPGAGIDDARTTPRTAARTRRPRREPRAKATPPGRRTSPRPKANPAASCPANAARTDGRPIECLYGTRKRPAGGLVEVWAAAPTPALPPLRSQRGSAGPRAS